MTANGAKVTPKWVIATLEAWKMTFDKDLLCKNCEVSENGYGANHEFCEPCSQFAYGEVS